MTPPVLATRVPTPLAKRSLLSRPDMPSLGSLGSVRAVGTVLYDAIAAATTSIAGTPAEKTHAAGTPAAGTPAAGTCAAGTPSSSSPVRRSRSRDISPTRSDLLAFVDGLSWPSSWKHQSRVDSQHDNPSDVTMSGGRVRSLLKELDAVPHEPNQTMLVANEDAALEADSHKPNQTSMLLADEDAALLEVEAIVSEVLSA